jgi:pimeloyl-ACP methyl ester carboxylesterase
MPHFAELAADSYGTGSAAAPLVLVHGLTYDRTTWGPALTELGRLDPARRAVAFDLPGHGESPRRESYALADVASVLHDAVTEAGLVDPVLVGHSLGGVLATHYATRFPVRAVVNVDQPLQVTGFADLLRRNESTLRGPDWAAFWEKMTDGMHIDLLPANTRGLVESAVPRQDQLLGYWQELLDNPAAQLDQQRRAELTAIADRRIPYHYVTGAEPPEHYRDWLTALVPGVRITVLSDSGHFPQLGHPAAFARLLDSIG